MEDLHPNPHGEGQQAQLGAAPQFGESDLHLIRQLETSLPLFPSERVPCVVPWPRRFLLSIRPRVYHGVEDRHYKFNGNGDNLGSPRFSANFHTRITSLSRPGCQAGGREIAKEVMSDMKRKIIVGSIVGLLSIGGLWSTVAQAGAKNTKAPVTVQQVGPAADTDTVQTGDQATPDDPAAEAAEEAKEGPEGKEGKEADNDTHEDPDGVDVNHECPPACDTANGETP